MSFFLVPAQSRRFQCPAQHGLAESQSTQGDRVEMTERMKRIAFDAAAFDGGIEKGEIESRVVSNQYRPSATGVFNGFADRSENMMQSCLFRQRRAQRVERID